MGGAGRGAGSRGSEKDREWGRVRGKKREEEGGGAAAE